jgi:hypothetical protein
MSCTFGNELKGNIFKGSVWEKLGLMSSSSSGSITFFVLFALSSGGKTWLSPLFGGPLRLRSALEKGIAALSIPFDGRTLS